MTTNFPLGKGQRPQRCLPKKVRKRTPSEEEKGGSCCWGTTPRFQGRKEKGHGTAASKGKGKRRAAEKKRSVLLCREKGGGENNPREEKG